MMNKLVKFTIALVVVLLVVSYAHAAPEASIVARQETDGDGDGGKTSDAETTPAPKLPIPAAPSTTLDTYLASKTPAASLSASGAPSYVPTGTGSLIPSWSALVAKGVPTGQPTAAPTPGKSADAPTSAANKVESGLIGVVIAGFAGLFF